MFILIALAILFAILFVGGLVGDLRNKPLESGISWGAFALLPLAVFLVVGGAIFLSNASAGNKLTAYSEANRYAYTNAIDEIREAMPETALVSQSRR